MKTTPSTHLLTAVIGLAVFSTVGRTAPETNAAPSTRQATPGAPTDVKITVTVSHETPSVKWTDIKDLGFDAHARFLAGVKALEAKVDNQIGELTAKRATMKGSPNLMDWDFAMKEMNDSRTYLKSTGQEMAKANAETWGQQKEKIGQAWARTQEAHAKVRASTTS